VPDHRTGPMSNRHAQAQICLGVTVQILAVSCWFATAAAVPSLVADYGLSVTQTVTLTAVVQVGFAVGAVLAAVSRLTDRHPPRRLIVCGSVATAAATALPLIHDTSYLLLVASRVAVGLSLATVYPTGMRAAVSWAPPRRRGLAVATMVAALTFGTAIPHLMSGFSTPWRPVLTISAIAALAAAALACALRAGPYVAPVGPTSWTDLTKVVTDSIQQRITIAYIGHMWEVYGLWVWLPAFLATLPALSGHGSDLPTGPLAFVLIGVIGSLGCLLGGLLANPYGKRSIARWSVAASALCALSTPLLASMPLWAVLAILALWGASVISDSPLYSAMTGDKSGDGAVGTAIALQMGLGYALSTGAIYAPQLLADIAGWQYAFLPLAIGPIISFLALRPWPRPTLVGQHLRPA
jgi:MFS family permease